MTRLGHGERCRCGDCGIEATRRNIARLECQLGMCDHLMQRPTTSFADRIANPHTTRSGGRFDEHARNLRQPPPDSRPRKARR